MKFAKSIFLEGDEVHITLDTFDKYFSNRFYIINVFTSIYAPYKKAISFDLHRIIQDEIYNKFVDTK